MSTPTTPDPAHDLAISAADEIQRLPIGEAPEGEIADIIRRHYEPVIQDLCEQVGRAVQNHTAQYNRAVELEQANAELRAERDAARADTARLDWLETQPAVLCNEQPGWTIGHSGNFQNWATNQSTPRAAIDAAMSEQDYQEEREHQRGRQNGSPFSEPPSPS